MNNKVLALIVLLAGTTYASAFQCPSADDFYHKKGFKWALKADLMKNWEIYPSDTKEAIENDRFEIPKDATLEVIKNGLNVIFCLYKFDNIQIQILNMTLASSLGHVFTITGSFPCITTAKAPENCSWIADGPFLGPPPEL